MKVDQCEDVLEADLRLLRMARYWMVSVEWSDRDKHLLTSRDHGLEVEPVQRAVEQKVKLPTDSSGDTILNFSEFGMVSPELQMTQSSVPGDTIPLCLPYSLPTMLPEYATVDRYSTTDQHRSICRDQ